MTNAVVVFGALAIVAAVAVIARRRQGRVAAPARRARLADLGRVLQGLNAAHQDGAFAVFLFGEAGLAPAEADALNVQFSVENGRSGIDWVLLSSRNVAARERVSAFFAQRGNPMTARTANDVSYLRTEQGDLVALCRDLLESVFGVTEQQDMILITEGFSWD